MFSLTDKSSSLKKLCLAWSDSLIAVVRLMFVVYVVVYFLDTFHYDRNFLILSKNHEGFVSIVRLYRVVSACPRRRLNRVAMAARCLEEIYLKAVLQPSFRRTNGARLLSPRYFVGLARS